jgi:hypothetical protein
MPLSTNKGSLAKGVPKYPAIEEFEDLDFFGICCVITGAFFVHIWTQNRRALHHSGGHTDTPVSRILSDQTLPAPAR